MSKKICIEGCIGCSACVIICPELFNLNENRQAYNLYGADAEIPEDLEDSVLEAIDACPVCAISTK